MDLYIQGTYFPRWDRKICYLFGINWFSYNENRCGVGHHLTCILQLDERLAYTVVLSCGAICHVNPSYSRSYLSMVALYISLLIQTLQVSLVLNHNLFMVVGFRHPRYHFIVIVHVMSLGRGQSPIKVILVNYFCGQITNIGPSVVRSITDMIISLNYEKLL